MKAYKLTDQNGQTKNNTQWGPNIIHSSTGNDKSLCSNGWIHFYKDPLISILMNPVHADFESPKLWECETSGEHLHEALKSGCKTLTTIKEIPVPEISNVQRIAFGILCVKEIYKNKEWNDWADKWLSGEDRSKESAYTARTDATSSTYYATSSTYYATSAAASAAAAYYAADASVYAASFASSAAVYAAAAYVAAYATYAAYHADCYADCHNKNIDFIELANKVMTYK